MKSVLYIDDNGHIRMGRSKTLWPEQILKPGSKIWTFKIDSRFNSDVYDFELIGYDDDVIRLKCGEAVVHRYSTVNLFSTKFAAKQAFMAALKVEIEWRQSLYNEMED